MKYGSLDTNVILRFLVGGAFDQEKRAQELIVDLDCKLGIADATFIELEYVLSTHYKFTRAAVADTFSDLAALPNINCNRALLSNVLPQYRSVKGVSFVDICLDAYAALTDHQPLYTFDKNLAKKLPHSKLLS
jgi:predicted nucleic-acid-binding protein